MDKKNDIIGVALNSFYTGNKQDKLHVLSEVMEVDEIPLEYFFRDFSAMHESEQIALKNCKGKVLDIGAGAGSHTLWIQQNGFDVNALDVSPGCIELMKERGVKRTTCSEILNYNKNKFDTLLLLMNGIGIGGTIERMPFFLDHLKQLLLPGGQVIFDSSDLKYLYTEEDGSFSIDLNGPYYGEMKYRFQYKNLMGPEFDWLYIDYENMEHLAEQCGFKMELLNRDDETHYLARLSIEY